jgi:hypothetical protein
MKSIQHLILTLSFAWEPCSEDYRKSLTFAWCVHNFIANFLDLGDDALEGFKIWESQQ